MFCWDDATDNGTKPLACRVVQSLWLHLADDPPEFIDTFCDPKSITKDFSGELGSFTPCFTDVVVLGGAHITAIILFILRLSLLHRPTFRPLHILQGAARAWQYVAITLSGSAFVVVAMQLSGRMAANQFSYQHGPLAPFEAVEYAIGATSWLLCVCLFVTTRNAYSLGATWMWRFPLWLIFAGELTKLRFVILLTDERNYFFWLYTTYVGIQACLSVFALFFFPSKQDLVVCEDSAGDGTQQHAYVALSTGPEDCPECHANLLSTLTFTWASKLMRTGYTRPLQPSDVWSLPSTDTCAVLMLKFTQQWKRAMQQGGVPSVVRCSWAVVRPLVWSALPFKLINDAAQFAGPYFLQRLLESVRLGHPAREGYMLASAMFVGLVAGTVADAQHFQRMMRAGFQIRSILVHSVYSKILRLSPASRARFSSGQIFNLVSTDAEQVQTLSQFAMGIISSPLRIALALYSLYVLLGPSSITALVVLVICMPLQALCVKTSTALLKRALGYTDERAKYEKELLSGMDVVKCSTWEDAFWTRITLVRGQELDVLWKSFVVGALNVFLLNVIPTLVSVTTFGMYVVLGNELTATKAFTALTLFNVLRMPLFQLPQLISLFTQTKVSMRRLQDFLTAEESQGVHHWEAAPIGDMALEIQGTFSWDPALQPSLHNLHLEVTSGQLVAVVGTTGSGKSSLLMAALGMMEQVLGNPVIVSGTSAYVPQQAFIVGGTVRENILFGLPYDETQYKLAITVAALERDLQLLPAGDATELGEQGVNISGGQKQRVAIARAVYANADVYLFDDPLSALDAKVGRVVFDTCIMGALQDKTRILVTNQLQFVRSADLVVVMSEGAISEMGTYEALMAQNKGFTQMMAQAEVDDDSEEYKSKANHFGSSASLVQADNENTDGNKKSSDKRKPSDAKNGGGGAHAGGARGDGAGGGNEVGGGQAQQQGGRTAGQLTDKESRSTGSVSRAVILAYVQAMGGTISVLLLLCNFLLPEVFRTASTLWLSAWTDAADDPNPPHGAGWYLEWYSVLCAAQVVCTLWNSLDVKRRSVHAADGMHRNMLQSLLRAPMSFFHTTPSGRIINRLTRDTSDIDRVLADFTSAFLRGGLSLMSTIFLVGIVTPFTLSALVPVLLLFYWLYVYFQTSVREIKRLDSISRSPVYSSVGEALNGVSSILAFGSSDRMMTRNRQLLDTNVVYTHVNMSFNRWLGVRVESLGAFAAFAAAALAVLQRGSAAVVGLTVSYALQITALTSMTLRLASIAENSFNAVERVAEYSNLPEEAQGGSNPPPEWPDKGKIDFVDVEMRYRPGLPLVLSGLTVSVDPGSKVGIVGRTGAGKSSIINCLFRLVELSGGRVLIDGIAIDSVLLKRLRGGLALIPQTPVLFTGSIRSNLSPFGLHTDTQLWAALERSHLAPVVRAAQGQLDMVLGEGGSPLSAGQKQLLALARALLKSSKVLVLDEATANVDVETDALVQKTVADEFSSCTLLAVAHRLHTVVASDKILVMDAGRAAEYGTPAELITKQDGIFASMVQETGAATAQFLRSVALGEVGALEQAARQASVGLTKVQDTSTVCCQELRDHSRELVDRAGAAREVLLSLLQRLKEQQRAASAAEALGVADAFLTASGEASRDAARLHTRSLLAQAVQAVSDIELLAEAAARSMGPRSTGGGSGGGGSGLGAVGIAGSGMDSGGTDTLPRRLSAGNPLQTRSMTLDPRMLSARARSFSGGHVAAGTPPEGDWRARLRDLLQDSVPVLPRLGRDADLGIHPSDVQE